MEAVVGGEALRLLEAVEGANSPMLIALRSIGVHDGFH